MDAAAYDGLARALRALHRTLMERAQRDYERVNITTVSPGELLKLLTTGEEFAWLRELSELMADIDVVRDADGAERDEAAYSVRSAVDHLFANPDADTPFARHYWTCVHEDPNVAMAHAAVRQALNAFPKQA
ncbi:MAG TPA: hypothetical protein VHP37_21780 [Burkholderiales bacterium]|nr:hypothetical protein [Burkholderiales bacterium]